MSNERAPALLRWGLPVGLIVVASLVSIWAAVDPFEGRARGKVLVTLVATPVVLACLLIGVRIVHEDLGKRGEMVLSALFVALVVIHVLFVLDESGKLGFARRDSVIAGAGGLLFVLLGPVMVGLPPGNALGIRVRGTLNDPFIWAETHRLVGFGFVAAGVAIMVLAAFSRMAAIGLLFVGPTIVIAGALAHAHKAAKKSEEPREERETHDRPTDQENGSSGV